jgi:hypothetical protein
MTGQLRMWTQKQDSDSLRIVSGVHCLIYISAIPTWRKDIENILSKHTIYFKSYLRIPIDLLELEVKPYCDSCGLSISSVSRSTRILLYWSPELYIHLHFYITDKPHHSLNLVILSPYVKASGWSGREQDDTLETEQSPRNQPDNVVH